MPIHHNITKVGLARAVVGTYLVLQYRKEMQDNYEKGDWAEAAKDTAFFSVKMLPVVAPAFFFGTLGPVWIGLGAGVIVTALIVEATGIGTTQDVIDLVLDPPGPIEWIEVVGPAVKEEIIVPAAEAYAGWVDRRIEDVETGWELINRYGRWRNPTPGLPFGF